MSFLLRTKHTVAPELPDIPKSEKDLQTDSHQHATLGSLISSKDPFTIFSLSENRDDSDDDENVDGSSSSDGLPNGKNLVPIGRHIDMTEEEGSLTIPLKKLPDDWSTVTDIESLSSLDRPFLFPGERLQILACLADPKQENEVITPFKIAALMSKNNGRLREHREPGSMSVHMDAKSEVKHQNGGNKSIMENTHSPTTPKELSAIFDISATETLIQKENHRQQTEILLERIRKSHFIVRIAERDAPLWSTNRKSEKNNSGLKRDLKEESPVSALIDRGNFDNNASGGVARNSITCYSLSNGDIVILLEVTVGIERLKDPVLEVLQFEQCTGGILTSESNQASVGPSEELLRWLLPLTDSLVPSDDTLSPSSDSIAGNISDKSKAAAFGNYRSYSTSSVPQTNMSSSVVSPSNTKSSRVSDDPQPFGSANLIIDHYLGTEGLVSFRGVPLEPELYSARCGKAGTYVPGKRWKRNIKIIQPIEIQTFAADCNTEKLLCVQIKNNSPDHIPDLIVYLDAINIIFEEAPNSEPLFSLPLSCAEAGKGHSLPNLALRKGEEHSFILKPANLMARDLKIQSYRTNHPLQSKMGSYGSNKLMTRKISYGKNTIGVREHKILVSYRCNYTESQLFFKKQTNWSPYIFRELMISVTSEISTQTFTPEMKMSRLPVQTLTLEATNFTNEDLTLTVLGPLSAQPSPVQLLKSVPPTPAFAGFSEFMGRKLEDKHGADNNKKKMTSMFTLQSNKESTISETQSNSLSQHEGSVSESVPNSDLGCTHLWLNTAVPLGCVPAQSNAKVKLELLPLTDGIITLDTLQIAVREKGMTYIPEYSLKIYATSSLATGVA